MILESLSDLYGRLSLDPDYQIAAPGYSQQKITFRIIITEDGELVQFEDARLPVRKKKVPIQVIVFGQTKPPGSGLNPCLLWDNAKYLLGYAGPKGDSERALETGAASKEYHLSFEQEINDAGYSAVCKFLKNWDPSMALEHPELGEFTEGFAVFQIQGECGYVHERPAIVEWWQARQRANSEGSGAEEVHGQCLITGKIAPLVTIHEPSIKGVTGTGTTGGKIFSANLDAFNCDGRSGGYNAPISKAAAFRYCTALNALLSGPQSKRHRIDIGNSTFAIWTGKRTVSESVLGTMVSLPAPSTPQEEASLDTTMRALKTLRGGGDVARVLGDDPATPCCILGLAADKARISVRFWETSTLGRIFEKLRSHYSALQITGRTNGLIAFPPVWLLLAQTVSPSENVPRSLVRAFTTSVLTGSPYPDAFAAGVLRRIQADREINQVRASSLKAWLTRRRNRTQSITMSLDSSNNAPGYLLGRLFATLEKTQEESLSGRTTLRTTFYTSASTTPRTVFPRILQTSVHHLAKLHKGLAVVRDKLIQEIIGNLGAFPVRLNQEQQAEFALGYYHQRADFFTPASKSEGTTLEKGELQEAA